MSDSNCLRLSRKKRHLRDVDKRRVVLRGVNVGGRSKFAPFLPFAQPPRKQLRQAAHEFMARIPSWGLDTVRLTFSWEALEPEQGRYDERYLAWLDTAMDVCAELSLRVILDFHQDIYASPFGGDGFPRWTLAARDDGEPRHDVEMWFLRYVQDPRVQRSFDRFWADEDGIQSAFVKMWRTLARRYKNAPALVACEVINEPGWGSAVDLDRWKLEVLTPFYRRLARAIRAEAPDLLIVYDGPGVDALSTAAAHFRPRGTRFVYGAHCYDPLLVLGHDAPNADPGPSLARLARFARTEAVPLIIGEMGVTHGALGGDTWMSRAADALDRELMSATAWEYSDSDELWNGENLGLVEPGSCLPRPALRAFARPRLAVVGGKGASFHWDQQRGVGHLGYVSNGKPTEVVIPPYLNATVNCDVSGRRSSADYDHQTGVVSIRGARGRYIEAEVQADF